MNSLNMEMQRYDLTCEIISDSVYFAVCSNLLQAL